MESTRRRRAQRVYWQTAASALDTTRNRAPMLPSLVKRGFTSAPYLVAHPEREIAEARGELGLMVCEACDERQLYEGHWTGSAVEQAISAAHRHNAERHPRRWAHRWDAR